MSNGQIQIPFPYLSIPPTHIKALVQKIRANLNVTTHKKKLTKYPNSFIGSELVTFLVKSKAVPTRRDAIQMCLRLFEARLIFHVKNNDIFKDDKELYILCDPVALHPLNPNQTDVNKARVYIQNRGIPKHESGYKQLIRVLINKFGVSKLPEISRAICLEKYKIKEPKIQINKIALKQNDINNLNRTNHEHIINNIDNINNINTNEIIKVSKKIIGILKYAFLAADQSRSNDLDLKEFEYLLDRLGIKVSKKGAELLFRAILSQHNKRFLGFYEFKMAFMVNNPLQFITSINDLHPAKILRKHIRYYYETVADAHKANRKKLAEIAWALFNYDKTMHATMNLSEFKEGIKYLGLNKLTHSEIEFIFRYINKSKTNMIRKDEFMHCVKKDIPIGIGKVVNVKEILFDTFERILNDYKGIKTEFPKNRIRNTSIVNKQQQLQLQPQTKIRKKQSIFQRIKYKSKRKKTIKAPVKSPFGSNLAEMADTGNNMMNDIILSMVTEDDKNPVDKKDDDIITAEEFVNLFSHPFYPPKQPPQPNKRGTMGTTGTISEQTDNIVKQDTVYQSDYSEMYPDIYPQHHTNNININEANEEDEQDEEEKQVTTNRKTTDDDGEDSLLDLHNVQHFNKAMQLKNENENENENDDPDDLGSYSPPPPTLLSVDVCPSPPWDENDDNDNFEPFKNIDILSKDEHEGLNTKTKPKMSTLILPDDILLDEDSDINIDFHIQNQSTTSTPYSRISHLNNDNNSDILDKIQQYRQLHIEQKELHENEEDGLSYYDENGSFNYKKGRDGAFAQYINNLNELNEHNNNDDNSDNSDNSDNDSLRQLQVQYQREQLLKGDLQQVLFKDTNIDDDEDIHPKDLINNEKSLKPSVAKRISRGNSPIISNDNKYDQLFDAITTDKNSKKKRRHSKSIAKNKSIPYTTPSQLHSIHTMINAEKLVNDTSQLVKEESGSDDDDDDDDPNPPGNSNIYHKKKETTVVDLVVDVEPSDYSNHIIHSELSVSDISEEKLNIHNPPQMNQIAIAELAKSISDTCMDHEPSPMQMQSQQSQSNKKKQQFMNLPPIAGVITLKKIICTNLVRGKMKALETYYLRVYQGKCDTTETNAIMRKQQPTKKLPPINKGHNQNENENENKTKNEKRLSTAAKLKRLKSMKFALPPLKNKGSLPKLCVVKSYPMFCKQSQKTVTWQNLPASITKDAKNLTVGIYMKREKQLVLIGSVAIAKSKKNLIPKPRIGIKNTTLNLKLKVPDRFGIWKDKSNICITYSFCPRQFNVDVRILQATKLPIYPSKIPVCIQLIRFHLLKITQDISMSDIDDDDDDDYTESSDSDSESDSNSDYQYKNLNKEKINCNKFYNKKIPSAKHISQLVGDMNSGHYKFDNVESQVVWHGLLRWFREINPCPILDNKNISMDFITGHTEFNDNDFTLQLIALLSEPYLSLFLWSIDFLIEMSSWYTLKLNMDNQIIDLFIPNLFGFECTRKHELFLMSPNAYSFVLRVIDLRKKQQFKLN